jgi:hypothetical protein
MSTPTRRTCPFCCALVTIGHAAAPPSAVMNARAFSFDDLVNSGEKRWWNCEVERFGGLEVNYQLELGRLYHGQVSGLFAFENAANVNAKLAIHV